MSTALNYDAVVIGAGVAGLTAATRLAESGASVCIVAKGVGSTHLAPGTIDVLGYAPDRVEEPARALGDFIASHPQHPYALIGATEIAAAIEWFAARIGSSGAQRSYRYVGGLERNLLLPTALGAIRPSALVPETMAGGEVRTDTSVCVIGMRILRDFHASLCAGNLARAGIEARAAEVTLDVGRAEANTLGLATALDRPAFRAQLASRLEPLLSGEERIGLPAILGLRDPHGVWSELEQRLGRTVFEIPTLPPSASGMRVFNALRAALRAAGGRLVIGAEVVECRWDGRRAKAVRTRSSGHDTVYGARSVVLASGGFTSGATTLDADWQTRETVLGLPLRGVPGPGQPRFVPEYFGEQPIARAGVAVDRSLLAEGTENVFVAGAALPGAVPWREGSGEGIALASGHYAARMVLEREGAALSA